MKKLVRQFFKFALLEKLLVSLHSGREYGSLLTKLTPNHTDYKPGTFRKVTRHGIRYELDISNIVDWHIYYDFLEPPREKLLALVEKGNTVIDVGANIGVFAGLFATKAAPGKVFAFEPFPPTFRLLSRHKEINGFDNLEIFNAGLGNAESTVLFRTDFAGNPGMNRVTTSRELASTEIAICPLDKFFNDRMPETVSLIKIDVEGFEFEVLKGAETIIDTFHPKLFIELDDANLRQNQASAAMLVEWLLTKGYAITNAGSGETITAADDFSGCHYDIICT